MQQGQLTFQEACRYALNYDVSVNGRARMSKAGLKVAALNIICNRCGKAGHRKSECKSKRIKPNKRKGDKTNALGKGADTPKPDRVVPTCGKCGKVGHAEKDCWDGDEEKRKAWMERMKDKKRKREGTDNTEKIRAPSAFRRGRSSSAALWKVGALRRQLSGQLCVDTGAMGDLMIIREEQWFETFELKEDFLGTAAEGGTLQTKGVGVAG
jgi:hypothetical protein